MSTVPIKYDDWKKSHLKLLHLGFVKFWTFLNGNPPKQWFLYTNTLFPEYWAWLGGHFKSIEIFTATKEEIQETIRESIDIARKKK